MIDSRFYDLAKYLWRGGKHSYYWTPDSDESNLSIWFPVDNPRQVLYSKNINIYFGVHPSAVERGTRQRALLETIAAVNCLFAEFDLAENQSQEHLLQSINQLDTPPSVIIFSGGGYHSYWLLEQTYHIDSDEARQRIIDIQYAWVDFTGSDQGAKDIARLLRVPGSYNRKPEYLPNYPQVEIVKFDLDLIYSLDDFTKQTDLLVEQIRQRRANVADVEVVPVDLDDQTILEKMQQKDFVAAALWAGDISAYKNDHSDADLALCNRLAFWFGRDKERIDRVFRRSNLYRTKWLRDDYRNNTIDKAVASCANTYQPPNSNLGNPQDLVKPAAPHTNGNGQSAQPSAQLNVDDLLMNFSADDLGNANSFLLLHGQNFIWCKTHGFLYYTGKYWSIEEAESKLVQAICGTLVQRRIIATQRSIEAIIKAAKPDASKVQACFYLVVKNIEKNVDVFDADPELLNCKNGVLNLRTGAMLPHNNTQYFTYCLSVDYDPNADYTEWSNLLLSNVGDPEVAAYIKLATGYTMTGHTTEECLFYVHGKTRSGKGTFAETLITLLGKPLGVQASFSTFTEKRDADSQNFDLAPLKPARLVVASESDKHETLNEAKVKTITGGDWIRCSFKHKDHFNYRPQFKIWLFSNHPIKGDVDDDAFWGRVKIVHFPFSHLGQEDKTLKQRMKSEKNLRGVLRWAIEGAMEWFKNPQGLQTPPQIDDANKNRRHELDFIQQWIDACCQLNSAAWTQNNAVYYSYKNWCEGVGIKPKSMESLSQVLSKKNFKTGVRKRMGNGQQSRGVEGLSVV